MPQEGRAGATWQPPPRTSVRGRHPRDSGHDRVRTRVLHRYEDRRHRCLRCAYFSSATIFVRRSDTFFAQWEFLEPLWGVDFIALGDERPFSWQPVSRRDNVQGDFVFYRASRTSETVSYALSFEALDADREKAVELQMRIWEDVVKAWRSSTLGWKKAREAMRAMVQALGQEVYKQSIGMWSPYEIDRHFYKGYSSVLEESSLYRWSKDPIACLHGSLRFDIFGKSAFSRIKAR